MKHTKTGFTLIEVLIAVAVVAVLLTPMFVFQGTMLQSVFSISQRIQRVLGAQYFFVEARRQIPADARTFTAEKKEDDARVTVRYDVQPVDKKSSLATVPGLLVEKITVKGGERISTTDQFVTYMFKPEAQKK